MSLPSRALVTLLVLAGASCAGPAPAPARVVVLADTHIIGPQYTTAVENSPADNESILRTIERLMEVRAKIHAMVPLPDAVLVLGDVVHAAHHGRDLDWYRDNESAFSVARSIFATFEMPVHVLMGNHDYEVNCGDEEGSYDRALSEALFREFLGAEPYYALEYGGVDLFMLNGQQGETWDVASEGCKTSTASFGEAQLRWLDAELARGRPAVVMSHYMGLLWARNELPSEPERADLRAVLHAHDNVRLYLSGHTHRWLDLSALHGMPHHVIGASRYDSDNFWLLELDGAAGTVTILDEEKAITANSCAHTFVYEGTPARDESAEETGTCVQAFE